MANDKMLEQFKDFGELFAFAKVQQKTLIELTKKNKGLMEEVEHLKKLLSSTVPVIQAKPIDFSTNDEESIAREQLFKLKTLSSERELTLEETRRVEIYSKILINLKDKPKTIDANSKQMTEQELIALQSETDDDRSNDQH